jgi:poly(A) polymerase
MSGRSTPGRRASPREAALFVLRTLIDAGFTAYFAGGCVRDRLMGLEPQDYDIATNALPPQVHNLFHNAHSVGESFGVMLVRHGGQVIEVASFRTDGIYFDGRHPESVTFSDAEHDAARRDFTINGLFENPLDDEIIDYVGGRADLAARIVRAIGNPHHRFREDHLRMLRAVRFAARFSFTLEDETANAIRAGVHNLDGISRERIGQEVRLMLTHTNRAVAAWELQYLGLDERVLGEPNLTVAPTRLGRLPDDVEYPTALAAWMLDRQSGGGNEVDLVTRVLENDVVEAWSRSLMLSNMERGHCRLCLQAYRDATGHWADLRIARRKRLAASEAFREAMMILQTVDRQHFVDLRREVATLSETGLAPEPLVRGDDLIKAGMTPGPRFSGILDEVYNAQLEGHVGSFDEAMAMARILNET